MGPIGAEQCRTDELLSTGEMPTRQTVLPGRGRVADAVLLRYVGWLYSREVRHADAFLDLHSRRRDPLVPGPCAGSPAWNARRAGSSRVALPDFADPSRRRLSSRH